MKKKRCKCGCARFETVDITPSRCSQKHYFTRCRKCGLVVFSTTRDLPGIFDRMRNACKLLVGIKGASISS